MPTGTTGEAEGYVAERRDRTGGALLLVSRTEGFSSVFRRYFSAAGYSVELVLEPPAVRGAIERREVGVLVLDSAQVNGDPQDAWLGVAEAARAAGVAVQIASSHGRSPRRRA